MLSITERYVKALENGYVPQELLLEYRKFKQGGKASIQEQEKIVSDCNRAIRSILYQESVGDKSLNGDGKTLEERKKQVEEMYNSLDSEYKAKVKDINKIVKAKCGAKLKKKVSKDACGSKIKKDACGAKMKKKAKKCECGSKVKKAQQGVKFVPYVENAYNPKSLLSKIVKDNGVAYMTAPRNSSIGNVIFRNYGGDNRIAKYDDNGDSVVTERITSGYYPQRYIGGYATKVYKSQDPEAFRDLANRFDSVELVYESAPDSLKYRTKQQRKAEATELNDAMPSVNVIPVREGDIMIAPKTPTPTYIISERQLSPFELQLLGK